MGNVLREELDGPFCRESSSSGGGISEGTDTGIIKREGPPQSTKK